MKISLLSGAYGNAGDSLIETRSKNLLEYVFKGSEIVVAGELHSGNYKGQDGQRHYTLDVWASSFDFCGSKGTGSKNAQGEQSAFGTSVDDDDIPF